MSDKINTGGYAFPGLNAEFTGISSDGKERYEITPSDGMTLRDYFAAKAMQGLLSRPMINAHAAAAYAEDAYMVADAMIAARGAQ